MSQGEGQGEARGRRVTEDRRVSCSVLPMFPKLHSSHSEQILSSKNRPTASRCLLRSTGSRDGLSEIKIQLDLDLAV